MPTCQLFCTGGIGQGAGSIKMKNLPAKKEIEQKMCINVQIRCPKRAAMR